MRIVLLGAPGSGKGTQAQLLQAKFGVPQVSSGDLLRDAVARKTELGLKAKAAMEAGQLVSDEIVLGLIRERLAQADAKNGFILDGFPRNSDQAATLSQLLIDIGQPLEAVLLMDVRTQTLITRLAGRRVCRSCGSVYNVASLAAADAPCVKCGGELYQRNDDKEDVIAKRLEVYQSQTKPLIEHYQKLGLLKVIKGEGDLGQITARMESALKKQEPSVKKEPTKKEPVKKVAKAKEPVKTADVVEEVAEPAPAAKPAAVKAVAEAPAKQSAKKNSAKKVAKQAAKKAGKKAAKKKVAAKTKAKAKPVKTAKRKVTKKAAKKAAKKSAPKSAQKTAKKSAQKSSKKSAKKVAQKKVANKKASKQAARKK
jgi:adenylate kinase